MHPDRTIMELVRAIQDTESAGWETPLVVVPSTQTGFREAFDVNEADGTRIAIVGLKADADLIVAALNFVLDR